MGGGTLRERRQPPVGAGAAIKTKPTRTLLVGGAGQGRVVIGAYYGLARAELI